MWQNWYRLLLYLLRYRQGFKLILHVKNNYIYNDTSIFLFSDRQHCKFNSIIFQCPVPASCTPPKSSSSSFLSSVFAVSGMTTQSVLRGRPTSFLLNATLLANTVYVHAGQILTASRGKKYPVRVFGTELCVQSFDIAFLKDSIP